MCKPLRVLWVPLTALTTAPRGGTNPQTAAHTAPGETLDISVLDNDHDPNENLVEGSLAIVAAPAAGTAQVAVSATGELVIRYVAGDRDGTDSFRYEVCDTLGACSTAEVTVTVGTSVCTIVGTDGDDTLYGGTGDDTLWGGPGADTLTGGANADTLWGGPGDDTLDGNSQNDTLRGGPGADMLRGGGHNDRLIGGPGDDDIRGNAGDDRLWGQHGDDTLDGGNGSDYIDGGNGTDACTRGETTARCEP